jgi:hypothetical protein
MWSRSSKRRPPRPPKGTGWTGGASQKGRQVKKTPTRGPIARVHLGKTGVSLWRKMRQRVRALWRWMVIRTVRTWSTQLFGRSETGGGDGDIRRFPQVK